MIDRHLAFLRVSLRIFFKSVFYLIWENVSSFLDWHHPTPLPQAFPYPQPQSMEKTFHTPLSVMDEVADLVSTLPDVARLDVIIDALCTSCTQLGVAKGWAEAIESGEATQPEPVVQSVRLFPPIFFW